MNPRLREWPETIVRALLNNPEVVKIYVIPAMLFLLDLILRWVLDIEVIDAGADMALLAVATFVSLLVDGRGAQQNYIAAIVVFVVFFLVSWIVCLKVVSGQDPLVFLFIDVRLAGSLFIGIVAFIFAGIIANVIIHDSP